MVDRSMVDGNTGPLDATGQPDDVADLDLDVLRRRDVAKWQSSGLHYNAWIADMDFGIAPCIARRLHAVVANDELGYPTWIGETSPAAELFVQRMAERYRWNPDPDRVVDTADVLQGVQMAIGALSAPGDGIVLHLPAYHPFISTLEEMDRPLVPVFADPVAQASGRVEFDYDDLEARLAHVNARLWILCHPHNPLGHVFARDELDRIADIAQRHDLIVISDEIHADLRYADAEHYPFATIAEPERVVTVTSASKAFNLAGLRWAAMHAGPQRLHEWIRSQPSHLLGAPNRMGVEAAVAAWTDGEPWLRSVLSVLDQNRHSLTELLATHLPRARYRVPEATYLAWVDVSECDLGSDPYGVFQRRGVEVSPGTAFGAPGQGFVRINLATSPAILAETVAAMGTAVGGSGG